MATRTEDPKGALLVLTVLEALCGYAARGATNGELAQTARTTPPQITRAIAVITAKGWARKSEVDGRFYPTAAFTRLAFRVGADFDSLETRIADTRRSMTGQ